MASKYYKAYKFLTGGKSRPGIVGVKPKSGGVVDEFKSKKLKSLGKTQRKLKAQDKGMDEAIEAAKKKGLSRKDTVKGRKFQRDNRRAQREGDKLRKDVLRVGKAEGGSLKKEGKPGEGPKDMGSPKTKSISSDGKRRGMKSGGSLKPVDKKKNPGLAKLPTQVRNKMGYMKDGGMVLEIGLRPATKSEMKMAKKMKKPMKKAGGGMVRGAGAAITGKGFKGVF